MNHYILIAAMVCLNCKSMDQILNNSVNITHNNSVRSNYDISLDKKLIYFVTQDTGSYSVQAYNTLSKQLTTLIKKSGKIGEFPYLTLHQPDSSYFCMHDKDRIVTCNLKNHTVQEFDDNTTCFLAPGYCCVQQCGSNKIGIHSLENSTIIDIIFGKGMYYTPVNSWRNLLFTNEGLWEYIISTKQCKKISDSIEPYQCGKEYTLDNETLVGYIDKKLDQENKYVMRVYNCTTQKHYKQEHKCLSKVSRMTFLEPMVLAWTYDCKIYYLWNIEEDTTTTLAFSSEGYLQDLAPGIFKFHHSVKGYTIYDTKKKQYISLPKCTDGLYKHTVSPYAFGYQHSRGTIIIYDANTWEIINTLTCKKDQYSEFSPCGTYILIKPEPTSTLQVTLYSIEAGKNIFEQSVYKQKPHVFWCKDQYIVFASDASTITFYNYHKDEKLERSFGNKKITDFYCQDNFLIVSLDTESVIFDMNDEVLMHKQFYNFNDFDLNFIYQ